jgi:hypothetical protein
MSLGSEFLCQFAPSCSIEGGAAKRGPLVLLLAAEEIFWRGVVHLSRLLRIFGS